MGETLASLESEDSQTANGPTSGSTKRYFGEYELIEEVAHGGMGVIYKARQVRLNRIVAIKMIRSGQLASEKDIERFFVEAEAAASLDHPGIVPIFEVGQENNQHYFSMAFVEGVSLAKLLQDGPLDPTAAAEISKKVAVAVDYAHSRGVIHRDLKPANILLAELRDESRAGLADAKLSTTISEPRITDFGLAKHTGSRSDLTETGQVLGTPSYMPPEQAQGRIDDVTETSDVYSLGAILYASLTGRPPFQAANPLETLMQVLDHDPVEPRQLNSQIPRDLETICLKCLEKAPERRYASARTLADDLGRFLRDEPIHARPMSFFDRGTRWLRKQGGNVTSGFLAVAATVIFAALSVASWYSYSQWSSGLVSLDTDAPPLVAEFFDSNGHRVAPAETIPTAEPVSLPAADYVLRVSGEGRLSQTYRAQLQRDEHARLKLNLDDQLLWPSIAVQRQYDLVNLDGRTDLIQMTDEGISRFDGEERWAVQLQNSESTAVREVTGFVWPWPGGLTRNDGRGKYNLRPRFVSTSDLNGDDAEDFVIAARHQAWLMGVSGATGEILWLAARGSDTRQDNPRQGKYRPLQSAVVGLPKSVGDLDDDGVSDLITTFADIGSTFTTAEFWVEAISAATGKTIWKFDLQQSWLSTQGIEVPYHFKLFTGAATGVLGSSSGSSNSGRELTRGGTGRPVTERQGSFVYAPDEVQILQQGNTRLAVFTAGAHLVALDCANGKPIAPVQKLPQRPIRSAVVAELDGGGSAELVFTGESLTGAAPGSVELSVWSVDRQSILLSKTLQADYWMRPNFMTPRPRWPEVADLDGDGRDEIIVPDGSSGYSGRWPKSGWGNLNVIDGVTGDSHWQRQLRTMDEQVDRFLPGPDINADGHREVFVATLLYKKAELYIDCLSGKDGTPLWLERHELSKRHDLNREFWLGNLRWWNAGGDGWPHLVVPVIPDPDKEAKPSIYVFSAGTGELGGIGLSIESVQSADMDGDGQEELLAFRSEDGFESGGTLNVIRALSLDAWRRIGNVTWQSAGDLDQDNIPDLIPLDRSGYAQAVAGSDGRSLWRKRIPSPSSDLTLVPLGRDLNGDNTPDILTVPASNSGGSEAFAPFHAISGRDGRLLWTAKIECNIVNPVAWVEARDLDQDGQLEVLIVNKLDWRSAPRKSQSSKDGQLWLVNLDGRTGEVKWSHALSGVDPNGAPNETTFEPYLERDWIRVGLGDLNDDGVKDIVLPAEDPDKVGDYQIRAISGHDGSSLWSHSLPMARDPGSELTQTAPLVADVDGDEIAEVILLEIEPDSTSTNRDRNTIVRLRSLAPANGSTRWRWQTQAHAFNAVGRGPTSNDYRRRLRPTPRKVRLEGKAESLICLNLWGTSSGAILLDHNGREHSRISLPDGELPGVWPVDIDDDGNDELIAYNEKMILAIKAAGDHKTIWQRPLQQSMTDGMIQFSSAREGEPPVLVSKEGSSLYGIDASTGKVAWKCTGPTSFGHREKDEVIPMSLATKDRQVGVRAIAYTMGDVTVCRRPAALTTEMPVARPTARLHGYIDDPRLLRDLPWMSEFASHADRPVKAIVAFGWYATLSTLLIVIPALYLRHLLGRGYWSLAAFLLLPAIVGIIIFSLTMPSPDYRLTLEQRFFTAVVMLPGVALPASWIVWAVRRDWRRLFIWVTATMTLSLVIAAAILLVDAIQSGSGTRYSWKGWYTIFVYGAYWIGWAMIVIGFRKWFTATIRHWFGRRDQGTMKFRSVTIGTK